MSAGHQRIKIGERVSIVKRGKKKIWQAEFHWHGEHHRESLRTSNIKIARGRAARLDARLSDGTYTQAQPLAQRTMPDALTISQASAEYVATKKDDGRRKKTTNKYESTFREFQQFCMGQNVTLITEVTLRLFDKYRAGRFAKKLSKKTVHNEAVIIKSFLGWCAQRKLIAENPLAEQTFEKPRYEPRGGPTLEQVNSIINQFEGQRRLALEILAFTGMRSGECQRLRVDLGDVDLQGNWMHIVSREGAETKTGNTWKVPIHPRLRKSLEQHLKGKRNWLLTENPSRQYPNGGHHLNMKRLNEAFVKSLKKLDIKAGKKAGGFYLHSLRSFFKTFCINNNVPREVVDAWQNHQGERRPTASDGYYKLTDEVSQEKMKQVPFGEG
jgi:integrase